MLAFISSGLVKHPEMVRLNPEYLHELMWGAAPRASPLARALVCGKLFHVDILFHSTSMTDRWKHDVDCDRAGESAGLAECAGVAAITRLQRPVSP